MNFKKFNEALRQSVNAALQLRYAAQDGRIQSSCSCIDGERLEVSPTRGTDWWRIGVMVECIFQVQN